MTDEPLSRHVMAEWVRTRPVAPMTKLILMLVFDYAGPDDAGRWVCYPKAKRLGAEAGIASVATVRKHLAALERDGIVVREAREARNGATTSNRLVLVGPRSDGSGGAAPVPAGDPLPPERATTLKPPDEASTSDDVERADENRPRSLTFRKKKVPSPVLDVACRATSYFAARTNQTVKLVDGTGAATDSLKRVAGAMLAHPELADPEFAKRTIDFALAAPWWKDEGPPGVGVVFGPKVVERMVEQAKRDAPPAPRAGKGDSNGDLLRELGAFDDEHS